MIAANKIAPLDLALAGFAPESIAAVTRNGRVFALPHWLCGNFLFYRKDDTAIRDAVTWADLARVLARRRENLFVDLFGHLTLGEWYITMLAEKSGLAAAQAAVLGSRAPDADAIAALKTILAGCPTGYCRSEAMHDRPGFYARAFVHGAAAALCRLFRDDPLRRCRRSSTIACRARVACRPTISPSAACRRSLRDRPHAASAGSMASRCRRR